MSNQSCFPAIVLALLVAGLAGCQSTPSHDGTSAGALTELNASQRQSYDNALKMLKANQAEGAGRTLQSLTHAKPNVPELWLNLALAHYQQNQLEPARQAVEKLLQLREATHQGHNLAGLIAVQSGDFAAAQKHYQRAIALQPRYPNALFNMALLQDIYLQNVKDAVAYYQKYLELSPDDQDTKAWMENLQLSLEGGF